MLLHDLLSAGQRGFALFDLCLGCLGLRLQIGKRERVFLGTQAVRFDFMLDFCTNPVFSFLPREPFGFDETLELDDGLGGTRVRRVLLGQLELGRLELFFELGLGAGL